MKKSICNYCIFILQYYQIKNLIQIAFNLNKQTCKTPTSVTLSTVRNVTHRKQTTQTSKIWPQSHFTIQFCFKQQSLGHDEYGQKAK